MLAAADFIGRLEAKVTEQLHAQRAGYLLGAGSSYLDGEGYPLTFALWDLIKGRIADDAKRSEIQSKLDAGASGIEQALDLLDDGGANDTPHRHLVTNALAEHFATIAPKLDSHVEFIHRLSCRTGSSVTIFSLNYDPLVEWAAEASKGRLTDGFLGNDHAYFSPAVFDERIGRIRGTHKGRQFEETAYPIHLLKLHGSLGWYELPGGDIRRCPPRADLPHGARRLMIPPQRRKATDTMLPPYAALWSVFRGRLAQDVTPINRLACIGYGFADEHVNAVVENALSRTDFTLLIFAKALSDPVWHRWSAKSNVVVVTEDRCSLKGELGPGHADLWSFEGLCKEV